MAETNRCGSRPEGTSHVVSGRPNAWNQLNMRRVARVSFAAELAEPPEILAGWRVFIQVLGLENWT